VKYLPEHGWQPSVLTVSNPSVPLFDESLNADVPVGTIIRRARTLEPGYALKGAVSAGGSSSRTGSSILRTALKGFARSVSNFVLQPDPQILWLPAAIKAGLRLLDEVAHEAIVVTAPPFSSFLVGAALARRTGLPLVLDYRDEWGISNAYWENKRPGAFTRVIQSRMERHVVRAAKAIVATTRSSADSLRDIASQAGSSATVSHIYNGYDPDEFAAFPTQRETNRDRFRIVYVGTLWNLTSVAPLVEAVRFVAERSPDIASNLELVFAGRRTGPQEEILRRLDGTGCRVELIPHLDHQNAINLMATADLQCLLLSDVPHSGRVVSAKTFEYMATGRPILAIVPHGENRELLRDCPAAVCFEPRETSAIADAISCRVSRFLKKETASPPTWDASCFDRRNFAGELAELLDEVVSTDSVVSSEPELVSI